MYAKLNQLKSKAAKSYVYKRIVAQYTFRLRARTYTFGKSNIHVPKWTYAPPGMRPTVWSKESMIYWAHHPFKATHLAIAQTANGAGNDRYYVAIFIAIKWNAVFSFCINALTAVIWANLAFSIESENGTGVDRTCPCNGSSRTIDACHWAWLIKT